MSVIAIINPVSGGGKALKIRPVIEDWALGNDVSLEWTKTETHARELAYSNSGRNSEITEIWVFGGDGTVSQVADGVQRAARSDAEPYARPSIVIIPCGTGNDLAYSLGIPSNPKAALAYHANSIRRSIDYGLVSIKDEETTYERVVVNSLGVGLDAQASLNAKPWKATLRTFAYKVGVAKALLYRSAPSAILTVDGARIEMPTCLIAAVGNGRRSGGMFLVTPDANLSDGLMDLCSVPDLPLSRMLVLLPSVEKGRHIDAPEVALRQFARLSIEFDGQLPAHVDGEIVTRRATRLDVSVVPAGLHVYVNPAEA